MISIIVALITSGGALAGVIISNISSNKKIQIQLDKQLAIMETKLEELTREVRMHNDFARRIPVIENRLDNLEKKVN